MGLRGGQGARRSMAQVVRALLVVAWLCVVLGTPLAGSPAHAAGSGDQLDSFDVVARVDTSGYTHVTETLVLRFGPSSARHGLERTLITREPDTDGVHDVVYRIDQVSVTSPSGASTQLTTAETGSGSNARLRIRIGASDQTITSETATYVLSYRVAGLLRDFADHDELYWDAAGPDMPLVRRATVQVTVPGGAQDVTCSAARPGEQKPCSSSTIVGKQARFAVEDLPAGNVMTVAVWIKPGLIANAGPILEPRRIPPTPKPVETRDGRFDVPVVIALIAAFIGVASSLWLRAGRDERFVGLPPGVLPLPSATPRVSRSFRLVEIPVRFDPPEVGVAEAGVLMDGALDARDVAAVLLGLAAKGVIELPPGGAGDVILRDPSAAGEGVETAWLAAVFGAEPKGGAQVPLDAAVGERAISAIDTEARSRLHALGVFRSQRRGGLSGGRLVILLVGLYPFIGIIAVGATLGVHPGLIVLTALAYLGALVLIWLALGRRRRTATARVYLDQIVGFRQYLATAEADQLRFEEGGDVFNRSLPWAVVFDLTDRWARVCRQLINSGRLAESEFLAWNPPQVQRLVAEVSPHRDAWVRARTEHERATRRTTGTSGSPTSFSSRSSAFGSSRGSGHSNIRSGGGGGGGGAGSW